jgi:hypothetical protein
LFLLYVYLTFYALTTGFTGIQPIGQNIHLILLKKDRTAKLWLAKRPAWKVTHILRPGKASEKTPKRVIPPSLCEISQNASRKKRPTWQRWNTRVKERRERERKCFKTVQG